MRGARVSSIRFFSLPPRDWPSSDACFSQPRLDERCFVDVCVYVVVSHDPTTFLGCGGFRTSTRGRNDGDASSIPTVSNSFSPWDRRIDPPYQPSVSKGIRAGFHPPSCGKHVPRRTFWIGPPVPSNPPCATGADIGWRTWTRPPPGRLESASTHVWRANHPSTREDVESSPRDGPSRCVPDLRATRRAQDRKERMRAHPSGRGRAQQGTTKLRYTRQRNTCSNEGDESKRMRDCRSAQLIDPIESRCVLHSIPP